MKTVLFGLALLVFSCNSNNIPKISNQAYLSEKIALIYAIMQSESHDSILVCVDLYEDLRNVKINPIDSFYGQMINFKYFRALSISMLTGDVILKRVIAVGFTENDEFAGVIVGSGFSGSFTFLYD